MFGDKKVLVDLREESGLNYFDKDQVEKAIIIAEKNVGYAKQIIDQASLTIKSERENTKIFTSMGIDESLYRRGIALSKIEEAKESRKESVCVLRKERKRLRVLKKQSKKIKWLRRKKCKKINYIILEHYY